MKRGLPVSVEQLLRRTPVETIRLVFKATWDEKCGEAALRTMCAFANDLANVGGGYVIVGVEEVNDLPVLPPKGVPEEQLDRWMQQIQGQARQIEPRYAPIVVPEQVEGRWVIAIWCRAGDGRPYEAPEKRESKSRKRAYVRTGNATMVAEGELRRQLEEVSARVPFDDWVAEGATPDELSSTLVHEYLRETHSRLANERHEATALYRNLNLIKGQNGHAAPTNVALLFFAREPRRWFRGAAIDIVQFPEGRSRAKLIERTIEGPLPAQVRTALEALRGLIPVEIRKHPDRAEAEHIAAWPFAAVEEALVNAVHHRGYDNPEPTKVEILPEGLRIVSYPGPVAGLQAEHLDAATPPLAPGRNRRIAELLKDLNLAEARGTGLDTIRQAMKANGSPPPRFSFDPERTYFEVFLPIHPLFLAKGSTVVAQPLRIGRPAPAAEVVGRAELIQRILRVLQHQSVLLVAPSGRGVSSLMNALAVAIPGPCFQLDLQGLEADGVGAALGAWLGEHVPSTTNQSLTALFDAAAKLGCTLLLDHMDEVGHPDDPNRRDFDALLEQILAHREGLRIVVSAAAFGGTFGSREDERAREVEVIPVPPLDDDSSVELSRRLLAGVERVADDADLIAIHQASAGIPEIIARLVRAISVGQELTPGAVERAFESLLISAGDPTGLRRRSKRFEWGVPSEMCPLMDICAAQIDGLRRSDLIARAVNARSGRVWVLQAVRALEEDGWLVEVDGLMRFEHPLLREEWLRANDGVPF